MSVMLAPYEIVIDETGRARLPDTAPRVWPSAAARGWAAVTRPDTTPHRAAARPRPLNPETRP